MASLLSARLVALLVAACVMTASRLDAQCPDGSPPPCPSRPSGRPATPAVDPKVIAVLPFRVTTTDSLLGEGFAELLATQFTGEGSPRAVDMATVINGWRRAGGGSRTPLTRSRAVQLARELGAGLVSEGSIVGLGRHLTVTTNLLTVPAGTPRGGASQITASADSLDSALRQTATSLIASLGGQMREGEVVRHTDSPVAMRLYLQGLALWRRGRTREAADAFDRAIALDSSFAQAMFRRFIAQTWAIPGRVTDQMMWAHRGQLGARERLILDLLVQHRTGPPRSMGQRVLDGERVVSELPDSPEALFWAGDLWYHQGAVVDPVRQLEKARDYFLRSLAVDSQATTMRHLLELALRVRDTATLRKVVPAYLRTAEGSRWPIAWMATTMMPDTALLGRLRRRVEVDSTPSDSFISWAVPAPNALVDEMYTRWFRAAGPRANIPRRRWHRGKDMLFRGRPAAADSVIASLPEDELANADIVRMAMALSDAGEGIDIAGVLSRMPARPTSDSMRNAKSACLPALWRMTHGDSSRVESGEFKPYAPHCAWTMDLIQGPQSRDSTALTFLSRADSTLRAIFDRHALGFEALLLARAWERVGEPQRALAAIRYRVIGLGDEAPWNYAEEGRLASLVGDTAGALRAYRYYLDLTADAEPALRPKRERIAAEVARLSGARR